MSVVVPKSDINDLPSVHQELLHEYLSLHSPEDRLTWLLERHPIHAPISPHLLTEDRRVPGCLSGLWLAAEQRDGLCYFSAKSESDLVQGIVSIICDLYSSRTPDAIALLGDSLTQQLALEPLLTMTRRRAIFSTTSFIVNSARNSQAA